MVSTMVSKVVQEFVHPQRAVFPCFFQGPVLPRFFGRQVKMHISRAQRTSGTSTKNEPRRGKPTRSKGGLEEDARKARHPDR